MINKQNWYKKNTHASKYVEFVRFSLFTSQVNVLNQTSNFQRFLSSSCSIGPLSNSHYLLSDSIFPFSDQSQTPKAKIQNGQLANTNWLNICKIFVLMFPGIFLRVGCCQYGIIIFAEIDSVEKYKRVSSTNMYLHFRLSIHLETYLILCLGNPSRHTSSLRVSQERLRKCQFLDFYRV